MGASQGKAADSSSLNAAALSRSTTSPDYVSKIRDYATSQLAGDTTNLRMAGKKLSDLEDATSLAEASQGIRYTPDAPTKAPLSHYLSRGSSPTA